MRGSLSKYASSLLLLEWGAIMLYFHLSGRVAAFLHPHFRPLLWVVGVSLTLTAVVIAFAKTSECCAENHHEHSHHESHSHGGLTAAGAMSFLVLCVPIALAAMVSPDRFGETFLRNRGTIETARLLPGSNATSSPRPVMDASAPLSRKTPISDQSVTGSNVPKSPINDQIETAFVEPASVEPNLPTQGETPDPSSTAATGQDEEYQNPALRPDREGNIHAEVIDLLYASEEASMRKDFEGKQVAMIGQVAHRNKARHERGPFQLVRFVMVCCAADVQPVAVMVQYPKTSPDFELMSWVRVVGKIRFDPAGDHLEPVVDALKVTSIPQPADQYLY